MRGSVPDSGDPGRSAFGRVAAAFLAQPGLPFANVLSAERIERAFARHGNLFGMNAVYSTVITAWSFLGQALRDGKEASCQAAVARATFASPPPDAASAPLKRGASPRSSPSPGRRSC